MNQQRSTSSDLLVFILRVALGLPLIAAGLSLLVSGVPPLPAAPAPAPWLPVYLGDAVLLFGVPLLVCGVLLLGGLFTWQAAWASGALLVGVLVTWVARDRLHNTMNHLVPFTLMVFGLLALAPRGNAFSLDARLRAGAPPPGEGASSSAISLFARVFLGAIFVAQGWAGVQMGVTRFAERVYVTPLAGGWVPEGLLWVAGVLNPPLQLLGGALFLLGVATRVTGRVLAAFLLSILFGHLLKDPFDRGPGVHSYALANLLMVLVVLAFEGRGNRYSLDALWRRSPWGSRRAAALEGVNLLRSVIVIAMLIASATPAWGQRANENAVSAAGDAFGNSVGNEKIGLYHVADVRGFSPIQAGNIRIEGLSLTEHGGFTSRVVSGSTIRVGLTAQSYPFLAPTGIADFSLRSSGNEAVLSPVLYLGPNKTAGLDVDAQVPIVRDRLSVAAGFTSRYDEGVIGEDIRILQGGGVLRWRPSDRIEVKSFYGRMALLDDRTVGSIFSGGPYLPPKVERRYFGLDWTQSENKRQFYGSVGSAQLSENWQVRAGLFRWEDHQELGLFELNRNVQQDGSAQRTLVATKDQTAASFSGELRSSYSVTEGARRHTVHLAARGRDTQRAYGGADVRDLGPAVIGRRIDVPEPDFHFGPLTRDEVRQITGGIGYEGRWPGVGELSLGVQKTDYEKNTLIPDRPTLTTRDSPWLYNATLALHLTDGLVAYAGYTRGLEESGVAPPNAVNRNSAPPALRTSQRDAGIRYAILPRLNFVAGLFDVRKPYFNIDPDRVYRELGTVRHRGMELSLAGQPIEGLSVVAGAVFLDADVSGEAVDLGIIGPKPVGTTGRTVRANFDYRLPFFEPLSVDLGITSLAGRVASALEYAERGGRQLMTEPRTTFDLGARYRFRAGATPTTLRAQITNVFNVYGWDVSANSSFRFSDTRRFLLSLAADL
jgi:iron complex outermembrane receptor protein